MFLISIWIFNTIDFVISRREESAAFKLQESCFYEFSMKFREIESKC